MIALRRLARRVSRKHPRYPRNVGRARAGEHLRLERAFVECPGKWVAINRATGEVVEVAESAYELSAKIRSNRISGVDILRAPAVEEPEVVAFG